MDFQNEIHKMSFYTRIHILGRLTVCMTLLFFLAVPAGLAAVNHMPVELGTILRNAVPILITFTIAGVCENLSFAPIIGSGALYMACVTGNVSNMKIPAAINAMEIAGYTPGSERGDVISIIAVASSTVVTTVIVLLGMLFLAPVFEPVYNNPFLQPAFQNMIPALFGALLFPYFKKYPKESLVPVAASVAVIFMTGRSFFGTNQSYIMIGIILLSSLYSFRLYKRRTKSVTEYS